MLRSRKSSSLVVIAIVAAVGTLTAILIRTVFYHVPPTLLDWIPVTVAFAILSSGAIVIRKGCMMGKYIGYEEYFVGGMLFVFGLMMCFVGFFGVLFFFEGQALFG